MARGRTTRLLLAATMAATTATLAAPAASAEREVADQAGYQCAMMFDGQEAYGFGGQANILDVTVSMGLKVPTAVSPGQRIPLRGALTLQFSEELRSQMNGLIDTVEGYSDTVSVGVGMNNGQSIHRADRWQTPRQAVGNPFLVRGAISFPSLTAPRTVGGSVTLALPRNNVMANPMRAKAPETAMPDTIAFTGRAVASGSLGTYTLDLACWLSDSNPGIIAAIPVTSGAASGSPASAAPSSGGSSAAASGDGATSSLAAAPGGDPFAPAASVPSADGDVTTADDTTRAALDAASLTQGVVVPTWLAIAVGVLASLGAVGHLALTRYRMTLMTRASRS
ncbi:MAG: hypothetical protein QM621_04705 [Aeromicrobium sp.]|uniref:DUF6801 domain-containing protein n=1 Tax=Aeromicrobium sp. TaxID=1871063 RepID=UPI0039E21A20